MGALHEGHASLIKKSISSCKSTVVSVFINPKQFSADEDFDFYPQKNNEDLLLLDSIGVDALFVPDKNLIYPKNFSTTLKESRLSKTLEGLSRPHFFEGVLTVVLKLFNIISPTSAFFGKKDYQQLLVVKKMVEDLNLNLTVVGCDTVREKGGLAMSSRNEAFNNKEISFLGCIYDSLKIAQNKIRLGSKKSSDIKKSIDIYISNFKGISVDYIEVSDLSSLKSIEIIDRSVLISIAVFFKKTRLIDNIEVII